MQAQRVRCECTGFLLWKPWKTVPLAITGAWRGWSRVKGTWKPRQIQVQVVVVGREVSLGPGEL